MDLARGSGSGRINVKQGHTVHKTATEIQCLIGTNIQRDHRQRDNKTKRQKNDIKTPTFTMHKNMTKKNFIMNKLHTNKSKRCFKNMNKHQYLYKCPVERFVTEVELMVSDLRTHGPTDKVNNRDGGGGMLRTA